MQGTKLFLGDLWGPFLVNQPKWKFTTCNYWFLISHSVQMQQALILTSAKVVLVCGSPTLHVQCYQTVRSNPHVKHIGASNPKDSSSCNSDYSLGRHVLHRAARWITYGMVWQSSLVGPTTSCFSAAKSTAFYMGKSQNRNAPSSVFFNKRKGLGHSFMAPLFWHIPLSIIGFPYLYDDFFPWKSTQ